MAEGRAAGGDTLASVHQSPDGQPLSLNDFKTRLEQQEQLDLLSPGLDVLKACGDVVLMDR